MKLKSYYLQIELKKHIFFIKTQKLNEWSFHLFVNLTCRVTLLAQPHQDQSKIQLFTVYI